MVNGTRNSKIDMKANDLLSLNNLYFLPGYLEQSINVFSIQKQCFLIYVYYKKLIINLRFKSS